MSNVLTYDLWHTMIADRADAMFANADYLTRLDSALGDGDHGRNRARGFASVCPPEPGH
jgi:hypothetical protein